MSVLTTEQKDLIYRSLLEFQQKQENILTQYSLAPDYENEINESIKVLKDLESILEIFQEQKKSTHHTVLTNYFNVYHQFRSTKHDYRF